MSVKILRDGEFSVLDYKCAATAADEPFTEIHQRYSLSYVRKGSFGCKTLGRRFELLAGGLMLGCPDDEFICTHDHHDGGDECLSFQLSAELVDSLGGKLKTWRIGALPPVAEIAIIAELAQAAACGKTDVGLDEAGIQLVARFLSLRSDSHGSRDKVTAHSRRLIVNVADWIEARSNCSIDLAQSARQAGQSPYHFLRMFKSVVGVTPHQHLIRCRLRHAAKRLLEDNAPITKIALSVGFEDISNFVRSFHRAAGVSPRTYRQLAATDRNFLQVVRERVGSTRRNQ